MKVAFRAAAAAALIVLAPAAPALEARIAVPLVSSRAPLVLPHLPTAALGLVPLPVSLFATYAPVGSALSLAAKLPSNAEHSGPYGLPAASPERATYREPTEDESSRALAEYRRISAAGEEIFDAPSWLAKVIEPGLKAAFGVAKIEDILLDYANMVTARIPDGVKGDPVDRLKAMRVGEYALWRQAQVRYGELPLSPSRAFALTRSEAMYRMGLVPSGLEKSPTCAPELRDAFVRLREIAVGGREAGLDETHAAWKEFSRLLKLQWRETQASAPSKARRGEFARAVDAALRGRVAASAAQAKTIYENSLADAAIPGDLKNIRHAAARVAGMRAGTVRASPNLGKQLRPTCTLHLLRGLLAPFGIKKTIERLAIEGRRLLGNPYIGSVTPFTNAMQLELFKHYGDVVELRGGLFESIVNLRRGLKIRIEIGDPVYQHSLILEGFYELDGETWVSLRDSTSYFPTRMSLEDFGRVLTDDPALYFNSAWAEPR
ncbi:MAG: hypothetical protein AAB268_09950 [Elusimicrobiota bacterium]